MILIPRATIKVLSWYPSQMSRKLLHSSVTFKQEQDDEIQVEPLVIVEQFNKIKLLGLNRPSKKNALNSELIKTLRHELRRYEEDDNSLVAVLYGTGGNFCAGLDINESNLLHQKLPLIDEFCRKPIVASISGYAVGEGFNLAMACDIRVMEEQAIVGVFNRRFGVPMSLCAINRLKAAVGITYAFDIILTGRPITTEEAFLKGLVTRHVPCGAGRGEALTAAQQITKYPQAALLADRAALHKATSFPQDVEESVEQQRCSNFIRAEVEANANLKRFSEGVGKHGSFKNLTTADEYPDWMN